jgi:hypothetical protein
MLNNFQAGCRFGPSPFDLLAEADNKTRVVDSPVKDLNQD